MLNVGDKAPDFEAETDTGEKIRLYDLLKSSHVVLYFYPKDFTPGCTREACSFRDYWSEFKRYNAIIVGVSADDTNTHRNFKFKYNLPFILISDKNNRIRELYKVKGFLIPPRVTYVIKMIDGIIVHVYNSQFFPERHVKEALMALKRLS